MYFQDHTINAGVCTEITTLNLTGSPFCFFVEEKGSANFVQCLPMRNIMSLTGITRVDFMSVDVEQLFFNVLSTIDFDKVRKLLNHRSVYPCAYLFSHPLNFFPPFSLYPPFAACCLACFHT